LHGLNRNEVCRLASPILDYHQQLPIGLVSITGGLLNGFPIICGITANSTAPDSLFSDPTCLCYKFNTKNNGWQPVTSMAFSRLFASSVVMDYGLYVIGGISQVIWILDTYVKDILYDRNIQLLTSENENKWKNKRFEGVVFGACAVRLNSTTGMLIGGGVSEKLGFFPTRQTWYFNSITDEWRQGPSLLQPRMASACGMMSPSNQLKIVVAGGQISSDNFVRQAINLDHNVTSSVEILDISKEDIIWVSGPKLPIALHSADMVQREDGVYLIGGMSKNITFDSIYYLSNYSKKTPKQWILLNKTLKISRAMHKSILLPDDMVKCNGHMTSIIPNITDDLP
jgi:N-acetylneuraminic acid mutarotase